MLGKLIKHEFKIINRAFIPLNLVVLVVGLLGAAMGAFFMVDIFANDVGPMGALLAVMMVVIFFLVLPAVMILPLVIATVRFWKSFLSSEGYLMFTLPVTRRNLILSRLIPSTIWLTVTTIVVIISIIIVIASMALTASAGQSGLFFSIPQWQDLWQTPGVVMGNPTLLLIAQIVSLILSSAAGILSFYVAMSIAQLSNSARVIIAIVVWIGLFIAYLIGAVVVSLIWEIFFPAFAANMLITSIMGSIVIFLGCAVMFVITEQILSKRLNLQ